MTISGPLLTKQQVPTGYYPVFSFTPENYTNHIYKNPRRTLFHTDICDFLHEIFLK